MKKYLVLKEEYEGQIISVVLPGMGKVKINTDKIKGDKSFYIKNGLGYLFEEIGIEKEIEAIVEPEIDEVIHIPIEEEKVAEIEDKPVKKKGGRPRKGDKHDNK
jgi:hypothetical protein